MLDTAAVPDAAGLVARLSEQGYLLDDRLAPACSLALRLRRPLFVEGEPDTGKTALAVALARALAVPLVRLSCHGGLDVADALYSWDTSRQLLYLRAVGAMRAGRAPLAAPNRLHSRQFLRPGPLLTALELAPCVLLVDDVDRADEHLDAVLLQLLSDSAVTIPEYGTIRASCPPWVVLTSTRTREVHDALKRRCHYLWLPRSRPGQQAEIVRRQETASLAAIAARVRDATSRATAADPGWARAAAVLGGDESKAAALGRLVRDSERGDGAR